MSRPHKPPPRICLKTYMRGIRGGHDGFVEHIDETLVCDFSRYKARYSNAPFDITENTGFTKVARDGTHYINNNIPVDAKHRRYTNARLYDVRVIDYKPPLREVLPLPGYMVPSGRDYKWENCWRGYGLPVHPRKEAAINQH
jgi:hypothetical protein